MIEIALSLAIIGFGLVAVLGVMPTLMTASRQAIDYTEVALAAQDFIEYDFTGNFTPTSLAAATSTSPVATASTGISFKADAVVFYGPATNVFSTNQFNETVSGTPGQPLLRTVRLEYKWPRGALRPQRFTFITEVAATRDIPTH